MIDIKDQKFDTFNEWVNMASRYLTAHPRYNEGINYSEPHPFKATCFDSLGRLCLNGGDMRRADEQNAFPVYWIWPDQIGEALIAAWGGDQ